MAAIRLNAFRGHAALWGKQRHVRVDYMALVENFISLFRLEAIGLKTKKL